MSTHSRSSSEVESMQYSEVLPVFFEAFCKDFSFADVKDRLKQVFTKEEYASVAEEKEGMRQILRLFWVLYPKEGYISTFLEIISQDYKWLADMVLNERNLLQSKSTERFVNELKMLRSRNQKHTDYNVHRMNPYIELRRALRNLKPYHNVVLLGDLGTGKKWLALDVCSEYNVMKAMDFQIYWIDVLNCMTPEEDLRILKQLRLLIGDSSTLISSDHSDSISNRILELQQYLRGKLHTEEYKNCLLVLVNVQNVKTLKNFNLGCKMLLITRNRKVSESLSTKMTDHITIAAGLELSEFYSLFERYLRRERHEFPANATDIYYHSEGHPHLLTIIAQNLRRKNSDWNKWIHNLQNAQVTDDKFTTVVETSLGILPQDLSELYPTFAIFQHSIFIPVQLLATLWSKTNHEAERIVDRFDKYSIVNKTVQADGSSVYRLPFIYSSHLKGSIRIQGKIDSVDLHRKVVEYYKIENAFHQRTEIVFCHSHHDIYFFYCIGYHLHNAKHTEMFSQIYLDFGFLEQKIRAVGLLNTIADLKYYEKEIANGDARKLDFLRELNEFLPKVEEKLVQSKDTCLLQYALMANSTIYEEASRQVKQFPDKVWFTEKGNFHQRRQIINLPNQAKYVSFLDQDICLIVLDNNYMIMVDISLDCNSGPVFQFSDYNKDAKIIEARLLRNDNFILTLDNHGELKLWSIKDDRRRALMHRRSSQQKVNPLSFNSSSKMQTRKCKQSIHESTIGKRGKIVAFHVEQSPPKYGSYTLLHVAFDSGEICVFEWNEECEEFESAKVPILHTSNKGIRLLSKILDKYYMMLNTAGDLSFWNLRDSSKVAYSFEWPHHRSSLISHELYTWQKQDAQKQYSCVLFVFDFQILCLTFEQQKFAMLIGELATLYKLSDSNNSITCAKLSLDARYMVLGTKRGIIIFDMLSKSEILRSNVSEAITCVDIYAIDDKVFKYIVICGSEHKYVLNIFALRKTGDNSIGWSHSITSAISSEASDEPQLEPNVWLLGQKLYDISYNDGTFLVAADSKNRIHHVCTTNMKNWSIAMPPETSDCITAITTHKYNTFVGYQNGAIFDINQEIFEPPFTDQPITYLQLLDEQMLVASAMDAPITRIRNVINGIEKAYPFHTKQCFTFSSRYLLLVNELAFVLVLDAHKEFELVNTLVDVRDHEVGSITLGGCDFKNSRLFLATATYNIYVYSFTDNDNQIEILNRSIFNKNEISDYKVSCLAAATDANLISIGLTNGDIEVYKITDNKIEFFYNLQSHVSQIYDMKFSVNTEVLVSCSEQLCFWSVAHMLNNPLTKHTKKRRSSRFSSQRSTDIEEVDAAIVYPKGNSLQVNGGVELPVSTMDFWQNKHGPADKPELLACIKFDGNKAEKFFANADFSQFNTIDNEGVYYHLTLLDVSNVSEQSIYTNEQNISRARGSESPTPNASSEEHYDDDVIF